MATFTRDWDEATPTDSTNAVDIDDYNRYLRVDVSDRIKSMVYGFTAGQNDGTQSFQKLTIRQQSSAPSTPAANFMEIYGLDDGANMGLYAKEENGYTKQILKVSGSALILNVEAGDGVCMLTGNQTVAGNKTFSGTTTVAALVASANLDIGAYTMTGTRFISDIATGTAPFGCTSTTKVTNLNADKVDGYDVAAYAGEESYTFPGGRIEKSGYVARSGATTTITFAAAFPNAVVSATITGRNGTAVTSNGVINNLATTGFDVLDNDAKTGFYWHAVGY